MKQHGDKVKQPYTFTAREWDEEIGAYYYRARYMNPKIGNFTTKDPAGFEGGINPYIYTRNPINQKDPMGLKPCCDAKLPASPVKEVALTCFAEASNNCSQGDNEKRAITDCIYNRVKANDKSWCSQAGVVGVLSCVYNGNVQFLGYNSSQYKRAGNPQNLDEAECKKLKGCISAAQESSNKTQYSYTNFNQTKRTGRTSICNHYFW